MVVAVAVAVLVLAGCSSDPESEPKATPTMKAIPSPSPDEAEALMSDLEAIVPSVSADHDKAIDAARGVCDSILGGAQNLEESTVTRFTVGLDVDEVSAEQATQIVALVKSQAWCAA